MAAVNETRTISIVSSDGGTVKVPRRILPRCKALKAQLDKYELEEGRTISTLTLCDITESALRRVIDYCQYDWPGQAPQTRSSGKEGPQSSRFPVSEILDEPVDPALLCELASAAYYLDCKPLVDITCRAIADTIRGHSPEEIRRIFSIVNDFTPAEEESVRKEVLERVLMMPDIDISYDDCYHEDLAPTCESHRCGTPYCTARVEVCGVVAPPPVHSMRDKLRSKLLLRQHRPQKAKGPANPSTATETPASKMSIDEMVEFIENVGPQQPKKQRSRRRRKARTQTRSQASPESPPEEHEDDEAAVDERMENTVQRIGEPCIVENIDDDDEDVAESTSASDRDIPASDENEIDAFRSRLDSQHQHQLQSGGLKARLPPDVSQRLVSALRLNDEDNVNPVDNAPDFPHRYDRIRDLEVAVASLRSALSSETQARTRAETRIAELEMQLNARIEATEALCRQLESRFRQECAARALVQEKIDRRQNALERFLITTQPADSRTETPALFAGNGISTPPP
ncbi:hypothetical protein PBRA_002955 [Plasmodiophora brassicae]|uniref:SKP1 component dimerisation domain-containing protein n=1 Tax=Plasmodiophora brassicae TaxID=37360 RepID=A0A0G4J6L3_PLABS|nr:hypothetical protein PBRA_002955 [Plasmodiophora brassicae]